MITNDTRAANRTTAVVVGILFLLGYVGIFVGSAFYAPYIGAPDYLSVVYPHRNQVIIGMLIELINDLAVIGIPIMLFPIFKRHGERWALGYLSFRLVEAMVLIVSKFNVLALIDVSQAYLATTAADATYFQTIGTLTLAQRDWASQLQVVFFVLSALIFYTVLYQTRLLPRFIAIWGFVAVIGLIAANVLPVPDLTDGFSPLQLLFIPIFLSELLVAIWLIARGFHEERTNDEEQPANTEPGSTSMLPD